jgi:MinD-like ATPase involved in chromosome partitioning or flagellar assembly
VKRLRVVTLAADPDREAAVARALSERSDVELVLRCVDRIELLAALRAGGLDAIISVGAPSWFERGEAAEAARAEVHVVAVVSDPADADRLGGLGASLMPPESSVDELIERSRWSEISPPPLPSSQPSLPLGTLVAVWGPKGAPGRTTVAIELAAELAAVEPDTLLVDGDPYGGDVLQLLGVTEELPTIIWAARMAAKEELDPGRLLLDMRRAGRKGPVLLPGLPRAELWPDVSDYGWRRLLTVARATFSHTVCDAGGCIEPEPNTYSAPSGGRNRMARESISSADHVVAVLRADPVGLKNFLWSYDELREIVDEDLVLVVANRVHRGDEREVGDLLKTTIGKRPIAYVPDRPQELARAVRMGEPVRILSPGSDICSAVRAVVGAIGGKPRSRGVLTRLSGRAHE